MSNRELKKLVSFELFAGAGGMALGIHQAGFQHIGLVEYDKDAAQTLKHNAEEHLGLPSSEILDRDARDIKYSQYKGRVDLLSGGSPCQPFSQGGSNKGHKDRRDMFPVFLDAIREISPKAVLIENVKGLLRPRFSDYLEYVLRQLMTPWVANEISTFEEKLAVLRGIDPEKYPQSETYKVNYQLVDTADYGVPQRRQRVLITAYRSDLNLQPQIVQPTHSQNELLRSLVITGDYWKRHGIRRNIKHLTNSDWRLVKRMATDDMFQTDTRLPWRTVREVICDLAKPVPRGKEPKILNHVQHPGARVYNGHVGSFMDYPAKALKAGTHGTPGGENIVVARYSGKPRYFTTREAARLQTIPDNYYFHGTWGACIRQLGNALPARVAKLFANEIRKNLSME